MTATPLPAYDAARDRHARADEALRAIEAARVGDARALARLLNARYSREHGLLSGALTGRPEDLRPIPLHAVNAAQFAEVHRDVLRLPWQNLDAARARVLAAHATTTPEPTR